MNNKTEHKLLQLNDASLLICIAILKKNPNPVSYSDIKRLTGLAKSTLHYNLGKLIKDDLLEETDAGYKIKNRERFLENVLKHYTTVFFGKILPKYIIFTGLFIVSMVFLMVSEFVPPLLYPLKFIIFFILFLGLITSLQMVLKYKL